MTAIRRRHLIWTVVRTVLLTGVVMALQWSGSLTRVERVLYNYRALWFQFFAAPPTDRLIHLDIDDNALTQIGRWPWEREKFNEILEEIRLAEPKVLAMDILFAEPAPTTLLDGKQIDPDAMLAATLRKFGRALVPTSFHFEPPQPLSAVEEQLLAMLIRNPELTVEQCRDQMRVPGESPKNIENAVNRMFLAVRSRTAFYERIQSEIQAGLHDKGQIKRKLLPHADPLVNAESGTTVISPLGRLFDHEFGRAAQDAEVMRFTLDMPAGHPPVVAASEITTPITPLAMFSRAARYGAYVDYLPDGEDGTVREVPLMAEYRGRLLPHMSIATACAMLDVDVKNLKLSDDTLTIPRPGGADIVIPVMVRATKYGNVGLLMQVPMFGKFNGWLTMYDYPAHRAPLQHVSIYEAWQICQTRQRVAANEKSINTVLARARDHAGAGVPADDVLVALDLNARRKLIGQTIADLKAATADPDLLKEDKEAMVKVRQPLILQLGELMNQNDLLLKQRDQLRAAFRAKLEGKALFLGGIETALGDLHPTSIDEACPGVIVHGAIFNAILTGRMWRVAASSFTYVLIVAMGLLTGALTGTLSPRNAFLATSALGIGYLSVNGLLLFDYARIVVPAGSPVLAALVWSGVTLTTFITEVNARRHITKRFSNYVDPSLVNYVINHPEHAKFTGETREMTMGFTDLAGFTSMTETLGLRTVPLLSEYMNHMIPRIRAHQGYVSRLMGDGIYFFFGAPEPDENHAVHAIDTVLEMHKTMESFNQDLARRDYPQLVLRAGICSGHVIVGDAGSTEFHDYTAIGDSVNIASRLESANKVFGTKILASARTIELLKGNYLVRPIANLRVAGKAKGVDVYEPLCAISAATPEQRKLAELSEQMVSSFQAGRFVECVEAADTLERDFGPCKFFALYRLLSLQYQESRPADFDGQIVLTEK